MKRFTDWSCPSLESVLGDFHHPPNATALWYRCHLKCACYSEHHHSVSVDVCCPSPRGMRSLVVVFAWFSRRLSNDRSPPEMWEGNPMRKLFPAAAIGSDQLPDERKHSQIVESDGLASKMVSSVDRFQSVNASAPFYFSVESCEPDLGSCPLDRNDRRVSESDKRWRRWLLWTRMWLLS